MTAYELYDCVSSVQSMPSREIYLTVWIAWYFVIHKFYRVQDCAVTTMFIQREREREGKGDSGREGDSGTGSESERGEV